ncbi:MAG: bifunctional phosphoribosylaminoimidazolecarboxamide formyltransferase/IMP cyclohydrolase [Elusimicrobia bacterium]|nr:bifunctional phosphoribosylaminoimidazolecarboxamide formyltransferase/IMP cyclohydrolase [Elusimicrobiota bacterium]
MSEPLKKTRTAFLSVSDRSGIVEFAHELATLGFRIVAAGGTAKLLKQSELEVEDLKDLIQFPDVLGGRLRLSHPKLLAAILANRDSPGDMHDLEKIAMEPFDLVAVNLYPVSEVLQDPNISQHEVLEFLDVTGAAVLRAAARNHKHVVVLHDPRDYQVVLDALREFKQLDPDTRQRLAAKAFHYTAYYDSTVAQYLGEEDVERLPDEMVISLKKAADLRFGENPHQQAALYRRSGARPWGLSAATVVHGKPLSYNHYASLEVAVELVAEFAEPACVIVKHANPAGVAVSHALGEAAHEAYASDPAGCTGGVAAFNREVDEETAQFLGQQYLECILAPEFSVQAMDRLRPKKDLRLVTLASLLLSANEIDLRAISGGLLIQDKDNQTLPQMTVATRHQPSELEKSTLELAWRVAKHGKTHCAVLARGAATLGLGCGQTSRMDAVRLAIVKGQERHPIVSPNFPLALASDGALGVQHIHEAAQAGVTAVIQPGGTSEDKDAIKACDLRNLAMVFTGMRHYRH